jgi:hypothetical protein
MGCRAATGRPARRRTPLKRIMLAAAAVSIAAIGAFGAPASAAGQICVNTDVNIAGTALPTNGENCIDTP